MSVQVVAGDRVVARDVEVSEEQLLALASTPLRRETFAKDLYFREAWADVVSCWGQWTNSLASQTATLTLKPEVATGRRVAGVLHYLDAHGFVPLAFATFRFSRHSLRVLWRHDWRVFPLSRLQLSSYWYLLGDAGLLVLRDVQPQGRTPAAARLTELKGSADAMLRTPAHLRSVLQPPNRLLNFVHCADEPADVIAELGIHFESAGRRSLLCAAMGHSSPARVQEVVTEIRLWERTYAEHDLNVANALSRVASLVDRSKLAPLRASVLAGKYVDWESLVAALDPTSTRIVATAE